MLLFISDTASLSWPPNTPTMTCCQCGTTSHAQGPTMVAALRKQIENCRDEGHVVYTKNLGEDSDV